VGALGVSEDDDLMLISGDGTIIRMHVDEISVLSRVTQGVTLMRTAEENRVVSMTRLSAALANEEPEEQEEELHGVEDEEALVEDETGATLEVELRREADAEPEETE
jgi:DNA gyrase subunit A